jgi:hypothetical protein
MILCESLLKQIEATLWLLQHDTAASRDPEQLYARLGKTCVAFTQREPLKPKNHRGNPETYRTYQREYKRRTRGQLHATHDAKVD